MLKPSSHLRAALAVAGALSLGLGAVATQAQAASPPKPAHPLTLADAKGGAREVTVEGEVIGIDLPRRIVTLKGPQGNVADLRVDPAVKNLERVKAGDRVVLTYRVGVALALVKGGDDIRQRIDSVSGTTAAPGERPGGSATTVSTIVANVQAVDRAKRMVSLRGPQGRVVDVVVQDPLALEDVKVGDQVVARVSETLAVRVRPAKAAAK